MAKPSDSSPDATVYLRPLATSAPVASLADTIAAEVARDPWNYSHRKPYADCRDGAAVNGGVCHRCRVVAFRPGHRCPIG